MAKKNTFIRLFCISNHFVFRCFNVNRFFSAMLSFLQFTDTTSLGINKIASCYVQFNISGLRIIYGTCDVGDLHTPPLTSVVRNRRVKLST